MSLKEKFEEKKNKMVEAIFEDVNMATTSILAECSARIDDLRFGQGLWVCADVMGPGFIRLSSGDGETVIRIDSFASQASKATDKAYALYKSQVYITLGQCLEREGLEVHKSTNRYYFVATLL